MESPSSINNSGACAVVNGDHNTTVQQNVQTMNNIILAFPNGIEDTNFSFIKDHITEQVFAKLLRDNKQPDIAFAKYVDKLLEDKRNRVIKKTNPNVSYCNIHKGDNEWELAYDKDALNVFTHHTTCATLEDIDAYKKKLRSLRVDFETIRQYVDDVNTQNDMNDNYHDTLQRLRLMIINLTRKWDAEWSLDIRTDGGYLKGCRMSGAQITMANILDIPLFCLPFLTLVHLTVLSKECCVRCREALHLKNRGHELLTYFASVPFEKRSALVTESTTINDTWLMWKEIGLKTFGRYPISMFLLKAAPCSVDVCTSHRNDNLNMDIFSTYPGDCHPLQFVRWTEMHPPTQPSDSDFRVGQHHQCDARHHNL
jgi:hypothetical protein